MTHVWLAGGASPALVIGEELTYRQIRDIVGHYGFLYAYVRNGEYVYGDEL